MTYCRVVATAAVGLKHTLCDYLICSQVSTACSAADRNARIPRVGVMTFLETEAVLFLGEGGLGVEMVYEL